MARSYSGCEVLHQDFLAMTLPESRFDGVFANASLFHVPSQELPRVLLELSQSLKPRGILFCSNPRGNNEEGFSGDRYSCFFDLETWRNYVSAAGFVEVQHYYRPVPVGNLQSEILVVQTAQNGYRQRAADSLDGTRDRSVLVQR
jgi:SAM-dependent methyltransferase